MAIVVKQPERYQVGQKLGRLTIIGPAFTIPNKNGLRVQVVVCQTDEGEVRVRQTHHIERASSKRRVEHGLTKHPLYLVHTWIKSRCYNPRNKSWKNYGGRGIKMCDEWLRDPGTFVRWEIANGWRKGLEIDRRENDGDYEPGNCRFVTKAIQSRNKRTNRILSFQGEAHCLTDWAKMVGLSRGALKQRLKRGWSVERALTTP